MEIRIGDTVQSKTHPAWVGQVVQRATGKFRRSVLIDWNQPDGGGHIRSWAYEDTVVVVTKRERSRYEKAIEDREKKDESHNA
jgi:hypothetical protein